MLNKKRLYYGSNVLLVFGFLAGILSIIDGTNLGYHEWIVAGATLRWLGYAVD